MVKWYPPVHLVHECHDILEIGKLESRQIAQIHETCSPTIARRARDTARYPTIATHRWMTHIYTLTRGHTRPCTRRCTLSHRTKIVIEGFWFLGYWYQLEFKKLPPMAKEFL